MIFDSCARPFSFSIKEEEEDFVSAFVLNGRAEAIYAHRQKVSSPAPLHFLPARQKRLHKNI